MNEQARRALHRATCRGDEDCPACQNRAEERANPEPLSDGESARMDDWAEKQMEAMW